MVLQGLCPIRGYEFFLRKPPRSGYCDWNTQFVGIGSACRALHRRQSKQTRQNSGGNNATGNRRAAYQARNVFPPQAYHSCLPKKDYFHSSFNDLTFCTCMVQNRDKIVFQKILYFFYTIIRGSAVFNHKRGKLPPIIKPEYFLFPQKIILPLAYFEVRTIFITLKMIVFV